MTIPIPATRRILTVCLGNICRSPLAAAILAQRGGAAVEVRSAGLLADKRVGRPADPPMITVAAAHGYDLTPHQANPVSTDPLQWTDIVLALDRTNLAALHDRCDAHTLPKLALYLGDNDVPDPHGRPDDVFEKCVAQIESGADRHLQVPVDSHRPAATDSTR